MQNKGTWKNRNPLSWSGRVSSSALHGHENLLKRGRVHMDTKEQAREKKKNKTIYLFFHIVFIIIFISFSI